MVVAGEVKLDDANQADVDLEAAAQRYAGGCPKCGAIPCRCAIEPR